MIAQALFASFYCFHVNHFRDRNLFLGDLIQNENVSVLIGIVDWTVTMFVVVMWINLQRITFMAYTQLI